MTDLEAGLVPPGRRSLAAWAELLRALVVKELKVKYKRSVLGFFWSLITPIALTAVYLFVFIYVYKVGQKDFVLFLLSGLLPWNFFNLSILASTVSLVDNGPLIRKVFFPRQLLPLASITANLANFLIALMMLMIVSLIAGRPLWLYLHWLVLAIVLELLILVGLGFALSVWNVYLRDIQQIISIVVLVIFFGTPIVYDLSLVPARFRFLILANPLASVMELYRAALFRAHNPDLSVVLLGAGEAIAIFIFGFVVFRRMAPRLAKEV